MAYNGHNGTLETSREVAQHADGLQIEYVMNKTQYQNLINDKPKNIDDKQYVIDVINSTYGLKGTVVKLSIER
jgi:hypothetical protein